MIDRFDSIRSIDDYTNQALQDYMRGAGFIGCSLVYLSTMGAFLLGQFL